MKNCILYFRDNYLSTSYWTQIYVAKMLFSFLVAASPGSASASASGTGASPARSLTDADWLLLEGLDTRQQRPLHTSRFLTMHKRRRRRLNTRAAVLGGSQPAILDDILHGQVQVSAPQFTLFFFCSLGYSLGKSITPETQCWEGSLK